jgi:hypothetical protein
MPSASSTTSGVSIGGCNTVFFDSNRQTCTMLKTNDLAQGRELDQKAMSRISGGAPAGSYRTDGSSTGRLGIDWRQHRPGRGDTSAPDFGAGLNSMLFQPNT